MRNKLLLLLVFLLVLSGAGQAQGSDIWNSIQKIEDNKYIINIPDAWKKVTLAEGSGMDFKFDVTGVGIPPLVNGSAMYGFYTVSKVSGKKEAQAMEQNILEFSSFYDRVTEPGYNYDTTSGTIKSGQTGKILHTRYYRRSKVSNYTRYYMVLYAPKTDETYILALNFQYKDPLYDIERTSDLTGYAKEIFAHFELR
ncbi:MAG: hypothetical protein JWO03_3337 [Bacteroidetes bacterium]|nr:hypothetical protein [Bacteroidota bacterium]